MASGWKLVRSGVMPLLAAVLLVSLFAGCTRQRIPLTHLEVPIPDVPLLDLVPGFREGNFRGMTYSESFEKLHEKLSSEYPFTEWKAVDWAALHETWAPRVAEAEANEDACAWYAALRGYLYAIPDANVGLDVDGPCMDQAIGGSYGFACMPLVDGRTIAHYVMVGGQADGAGMEWGAEIVTWNGAPVADALAQVSLVWADTVPATAEGRALARHQLLTRAPVGERAEVGFRNPGAGAVETLVLEAEEDGYDTIAAWSGIPADIGEFESAFSSTTLDSGYGRITMRFMASTVFMPFPDRGFRKAVNGFVEHGVPGLIIDLRGNAGGDNALVPYFAGYFHAVETQYADYAFARNRDGDFVVMPRRQLMVEPKEPAFPGPVIVLVDHATTGAAEGFAMALQRLPQARVVGYHGTRGAFSADGGSVSMPGGHNVWYPIGRALDFYGNIQLEADAQGAGGVTPDVLVPLTFETAKARFLQDEDPLMEQAVALLDQTTGRTR